MADESSERDLEVLLSFLLNRQLKSGEVIVSLGISRSTYYDQKARGELTTPTNLVTAATYFGLNPLDLLVPYGYVTMIDIDQYYWARYPQGPHADPIVVTSRRGVSNAEDVAQQHLPVEGSPKRHLGSAI